MQISNRSFIHHRPILFMHLALYKTILNIKQETGYEQTVILLPSLHSLAIFSFFFLKFLHRVLPNIRTNEFFDILRQLNNSTRRKKNKILILSTEFSVVIFIQLPFLPMIKFSNTSRYDVIHQMFVR